MAEISYKIKLEMDNISMVLSELKKVDDISTLSMLELAGVATFLHNVYNGVENILKLSLELRHVQVPTSATWHRDLLNLTVKHQIISQEVRDNIAEYMGFRHFFIHAYGFQLDYELIKSLAENVADVYFDFKSEIEQFLSRISE